MIPELSATAIAPKDGCTGMLVGRIWVDSPHAGPRCCVLRPDGLYDLSALAPTLSDLFEQEDCAERIRNHAGRRLCLLDDALREGTLLAPCDLQAIKATGVTFAESLIERVIEERVHGDMHAAHELREKLTAAVGGTLRGLKPGSREAEMAKEVLMREGVWSQYLEVGIGPDAEIFTKAQPLSAVGCGAEIGIHPKSTWSAPEPEIVLAVTSSGRVIGATLGNDLTLRDFEGRSALLLTKAKDNNASCAIGPFVRLFDATFSMDDVRSASVQLRVEGQDHFVTEGVSSMSQISRDPLELVASTINTHHQYPDGLMLFLGTMFVPTADRRGPGDGFTHEVGDVVYVKSPKLGALVNQVTFCDRAPAWRFGFRALMASLSARGLL